MEMLAGLYQSNLLMQEHRLYNIHDHEAPHLMFVEQKVDDRKVPMDRCSSDHYAKENTAKLFTTVPLSKSEIALKTYTLERMSVVGQQADVKYKGQVRLILIDRSGPKLLGRNWLKCRKLDWPQLP